MIRSIRDFLNAKPYELLDGVFFGSYSGEKIWNIPDEYWKKISNHSGIDYNEILEKVKKVKELKQKLEEKPKRRKIDPKKIPDFLFPHQKEYLLRFGDMNYSNFWASVGTGKTFAYLELVRQKINKDEKVLVLCPKAVFNSWNNAIKKYYNERATFVNLSGSSKDKIEKLSCNCYFYITNYESLLNEEILEKLIEKEFSFIVLDEAHKYISNTKTKTFKNIMKLSSNIENRNILTGTPRRSKDEDLYALITFLDRGERFGSSFYKFRDKYFYLTHNGFSYKLKYHLQEDFWQKIKSCSFIATNENLKIPEILESEIEIELTDESKKQYIEMHKEAMIEIENFLKNEKITVAAEIQLTKILKLRQICSGFVHHSEENITINFNKNKIETLEEILSEIDEQVLIVCNFQQEILDIKQLLEKMKLNFGIVSGKEKDKNRNEAIDLFSNNKLDCLILQENSGGVGIDGLQNHCSLMIRYSHSYSYSNDQQVIGRLARTGQKNSVRILRFKTILSKEKHTIEQAILDSIKEKENGFVNLIQKIRGEV